MRLNRPDIARLIPHAGRMALLDGVLDWTAETLRARAGTHRAPDNPLRRAGRLSVLAGIEYAAQAAAVHGALLTADAMRNDEVQSAADGVNPGIQPRPGVLALVREVRWTVDRLDAVAGDLDIHVSLLTAQTDSTLYDFRLAAAGADLLGGRLAIFFPEERTLP